MYVYIYIYIYRFKETRVVATNAEIHACVLKNTCTHQLVTHTHTHTHTYSLSEYLQEQEGASKDAMSKSSNGNMESTSTSSTQRNACDEAAALSVLSSPGKFTENPASSELALSMLSSPAKSPGAATVMYKNADVKHPANASSSPAKTLAGAMISAGNMHAGSSAANMAGKPIAATHSNNADLVPVPPSPTKNPAGHQTLPESGFPVSGSSLSESPSTKAVDVQGSVAVNGQGQNHVKTAAQAFGQNKSGTEAGSVTVVVQPATSNGIKLQANLAPESAPHAAGMFS